MKTITNGAHTGDIGSTPAEYLRELSDIEHEQPAKDEPQPLRDMDRPTLMACALHDMDVVRRKQAIDMLIVRAVSGRPTTGHNVNVTLTSEQLHTAADVVWCSIEAMGEQRRDELQLIARGLRNIAENVEELES
jgi:hypothetical protein